MKQRLQSGDMLFVLKRVAAWKGAGKKGGKGRDHIERVKRIDNEKQRCW